VVAIAVGVSPVEVLKVWVVAGLLGRDATGGVVDEHHLQKLQTWFVEIRAEGCTVITSPLREGRFEVGV
jgi:hypothetical protein